MRHIMIFETEKLKIKELPDEVSLSPLEANELETYVINNQLKKKFIQWDRDSVCLINYVGFIQCASFSLEILPKLNARGNHRIDRHTLLMMLDEVYQLHITTSRAYTLTDDQFSLFHIFAHIYTEELLHEFKRGIHSQYRTIEKNNYHLKGKINIPQHMKHNMLRKRAHLVYSSFAEHSHNNAINQLFLSTNLLLQNHIKHNETLAQLHQLNHQLFDVDQLIFTRDMLYNIRLDRQLHRYRTAIHLAKLFQQHFTGGITTGKHDAFSLLFDMSELYEKYIATLIQRFLPVTVSIQDSTHALFNRKGQGPAARIFPDIVIKQDDSDIIIDTKWKAYNSFWGIDENDLVQMHKYLCAYRHCQVAYVLYPEATMSHASDNDEYSLLPYQEKKVIPKTIPLNDKQETICFLKKMIL